MNIKRYLRLRLRSRIKKSFRDLLVSEIEKTFGDFFDFSFFRIKKSFRDFFDEVRPFFLKKIIFFPKYYPRFFFGYVGLKLRRISFDYVC